MSPEKHRSSQKQIKEEEEESSEFEKESGISPGKQDPQRLNFDDEESEPADENNEPKVEQQEDKVDIEDENSSETT